MDFKHLLKIIETRKKVFEDKWFAHAVKERTLDNLITEILIWLLDERVPRMHDGSQLLKVLNVLMLKILDLQSTIDKVDLDHILQIIHVYLQELGIDEIRRSENWLQSTTTTTYPIPLERGMGEKQTRSIPKVDISSLLQNARLRRNISEEEIAGLKQTFEMIDAEQFVPYYLV
ncbi:hypothetical protein Tco_0895701 [Tanacetum coccineum]|uniref:Uncharacterized protein n=1 Tax=Tanacetum coccineum TaxID=301880 RepID=A0ABQ5CLL1_9ASTR